MVGTAVGTLRNPTTLTTHTTAQEVKGTAMSPNPMVALTGEGEAMSSMATNAAITEPMTPARRPKK